MRKIIDTLYLGTFLFLKRQGNQWFGGPEVMAAILSSLILTLNLVTILTAANWDLHVVLNQIAFFVVMSIFYLTYIKNDQYKNIKIEISPSSKRIIAAYYLLSLLLPFLI